MKKTIIILSILCSPLLFPAQPNCNIYLWQGDTTAYEACRYMEENASNHYQFDWRQMAVWDTVLTMNPRFACAWRERSIPFLKAGNFIEWKKHIDQAVKFEPEEYLPVRASLRRKFFADYQGALNDLDAHLEYRDDPGFTHDGTYHLNMVRALCHKALGNRAEAIQIMEEHLAGKPLYISLYDRLHLGVLYFEEGRYAQAMELFEQQIQEYDMADLRYHMARCYHAMGKSAEAHQALSQARSYFESELRMLDPYHSLVNQIYLQDIEELEGLLQ